MKITVILKSQNTTFPPTSVEFNKEDQIIAL